MASVVAHIVYANQYLEVFPAISSKEDFFLGVTFPDIRRVSNVSRDETHHHFKHLDLQKKGLTDFEFGWKFHVWCDLRRVELLRDKNFFDFQEVKSCHFLSCYFLEDMLIWSQYRNWETVYNIFQNPVFIKTLETLNKSDWVYWYRIVGDYIKDQPISQSIDKFCKLQPSMATKAARIIDEIDLLRKNKKIVEILSSVCLEMIPQEKSVV